MRRTICSMLPVLLFVLVPEIRAQELVLDIKPGPEGSIPRALVRLDNQFFFQARTAAAGTELWLSDGSAAGTRMVLDIAPGEASSEAEPLVSVNGSLFFNTINPVGLWKTDGTEAGTLKLVEFDSGSAREAWAVGDLVFFRFSPGNGAQLWYTDGTVSGTRRVTFGSAGTTGYITFDQVGDVAVFRGVLYFTAGLPDNSGTLRKIGPANLTPEEVFSSELTFPLHLYASLNRLYILGTDDGVVHSLWKSDGTLAGTSEIALFTGGTHASDARFIGSNGDTVYFSADDGVHGFEPWVSDGTPGGTLLLKDINPGGDRSTIWDGIAHQDRYFFATSDDEFGSELWVTDGSPEGTALFRDINPGPTGSQVNILVSVDDRIVFSATDGVHGRELWMTAGTPIQTTMIADITPGPDDSMPRDFLQIGDFLYFSAENAVFGRELWKLDLKTVSVANESIPVNPVGLVVSDPFPNPFGSETTLRYDIPAAVEVHIALYNMLGQNVKELFGGYQGVGPHRFSVDAGDLVSGIYFVRIQAGSSVRTRRLILVR